LLHGVEDAWPVTVVFDQQALLAVQRHSESDLAVELGGVLVGQVSRHQGQSIVHVRAALPAHSDQHGPVHFTFTADAWRGLNQDRRQHYPDQQIVGWFHTHPDLGVFFSGDDVVVHQAAFTQPWHVGLVVDPVRREMALFGWEGRTEQQRVVPIRGFLELPVEQPDPITGWRVPRRTPVWAQYSESEAAAAQPLSSEFDAERAMAASAGEVTPAPAMALPLAFLAVLLALLALGTALPQRDRIDNLEAVIGALGAEALREANADGLARCANPNLVILAPRAGLPLAPGTRVQVVGTAELSAARYALAVRPAGSGPWRLISEFDENVTAGALGEWTTPLATEPYEMQLEAVGASGASLASCWIIIPTDG
jgi:proteasome lid subunit RPN8/RPN11